MGFKPHALDLEDLLTWAADELERHRLDADDRAALVASLRKRAELMRGVADQLRGPLAIAATFFEGLDELVRGGDR